MNHVLLYRLRREHARLKEAIASESRRRSPDLALVSDLKKRKLVLKDRIAGLEELQSSAA